MVTCIIFNDHLMKFNYILTARDFNEFIRDSGLMEPKMGGFRFTCFRDADTKLSKLDRFLHSPCFLDIASNVTVTNYLENYRTIVRFFYRTVDETLAFPHLNCSVLGCLETDLKRRSTPVGITLWVLVHQTNTYLPS